MTDLTSHTNTPAQSPDDPTFFRYVLGQYPTGVTLITAMGSDGEPIGMVVGTFSSVSLSPPLVSFMPDRKSTSWPKIREAGSFSATVLTAAHEDLCRAFARKDEDRFSSNSWAETTSGGLRLESGAAWFDCTVEQVLPAGDHDIVLAKVNELGVGDSDHLPLLFLRGGYGSFSMPSIQSLDAFLPQHTRAVDAARAEIESLAEALQLECLVSVAVEDTVVLVSGAGVQYNNRPGMPSRVGISYPLAAPFSSIHVAWAGEAAARRWLATAARQGWSIDPDLARAELATVRNQGYAVSTGRDTRAEFDRRLNAGLPAEADVSVMLPDNIARVQKGTSGLPSAGELTSLHAPVFGPDGRTVLSLRLNGFTGEESAGRLQHCLAQLMDAAARVTERIGGSPPSGTHHGRP